MRKIWIVALALVAVGLVSWLPEASANTPAQVAKRIQNQQERINSGLASGQLTRREADTVQDNLNWIRMRFASMKRDGLLVPGELARLEEMLDRNSRMINRETRDFENIYSGNFPERIREQQERINGGIASGQLTRVEADILLDNLDRIRAAFARMKQDRVFTAREMNRLDELLDRNSQMIYKKKHSPARIGF
jgi:hypothetical protein